MFRDRRFRRVERLRLRLDFARVYARRCRSGDDLLVVYVAENGLEWSRFGLSVSRRVGRAVQRNRVRRCLREAFRGSKSELPAGIDIICIPKPSTVDQGGTALARSMRLLTVKAAKKLRRGRRIKPTNSESETGSRSGAKS